MNLWHISGENLRSDAHVLTSTLRFGAQLSSRTALKDSHLEVGGLIKLVRR